MKTDQTLNPMMVIVIVKVKVIVIAIMIVDSDSETESKREDMTTVIEPICQTKSRYISEKVNLCY